MAKIGIVHSMEPSPSSPDGTQPGIQYDARPDTQSDAQSDAQSSGGWLFPVLLAVLLLGLIAFGKWTPNPAPRQQAGPAADWSPSPQPTGETVRLTIDFGNGASKKFAALPWQAGMTVADLLVAAREFRPGVEFVQVGAGEGGFLQSLDGLSNEGASGRNWLYQVDGQHAHRSFCLETIKTGRHILWKFTAELYNDGAGE